jgi:hypothetical protein
MLRTIELLAKELINPSEFFSSVWTEGWKPAFVFFLWITLFISVVTPIVNYFWNSHHGFFCVLSVTNLGVQFCEKQFA